MAERRLYIRFQPNSFLKQRRLHIHLHIQEVKEIMLSHSQEFIDSYGDEEGTGIEAGSYFIQFSPLLQYQASEGEGGIDSAWIKSLSSYCYIEFVMRPEMISANRYNITTSITTTTTTASHLHLCLYIVCDL